jgi:membrane protein
VIGFLRHDTIHYAGSMAYFAVMSVFQILVLGVVLVSSLLDDGATRELFLARIGSGSVLDRQTVADLIDGTLAGRGGMTLISFVLLAWSGLGMFAAVSRGVSRAFDDTPDRHLFWDQVSGLLLMGLTGGLIVGAVAIGLVTGALQQFANEGLIGALGGEAVVAVIGLALPGVLAFVAFWVLYRVVPRRRPGWRAVLPGAIAATLMWTLLRIGFTFYATNVASFDSVFGPIATGITFLVFLYLASIVVLIGAEVARASALDAA